MHRPSFLALIVVVAALLGPARPASADITAFLGFSPTTATRTALGVAVGGGFLVVGFEFEYSSISEDAEQLAPGLKTGMANLLVQTPFPIAGLQFYGTAGGGFYAEDLGVATEKNVGANIGGGVKIHLLGPLRARIDYRVFKLRGSPINDKYHRFYAGVNLGF
jgi:hypothetical protein